MSSQITSLEVFELPKKQVEVLRSMVVSEGEGAICDYQNDFEYQLLCNLLERAENLIVGIMKRITYEDTESNRGYSNLS